MVLPGPSPLSRLEGALVILCIGTVVAAELFNAAVESLVDLYQEDYHPLAGRGQGCGRGRRLDRRRRGLLGGGDSLHPKTVGNHQLLMKDKDGDVGIILAR